MKKIYVLIVIALITLGGLIWWGVSELQKVTVSFQLSNEVRSVKIARDGNVVATVTNNTKLKLKKGDYTLTIDGEKIGTTNDQRTIETSGVIAINPSYSESYLAEQYQTQASSLLAALREKFSSQMNDFTVANARLFQKADWAGGVLTPQNMDPQNPERVYRFVAKKTGDSWSIVEKPQPILTKYAFPDIPIDVLRQINRLNYSSSEN